MSSVGCLSYDIVLKKELTDKLEEVLRLVKSDSIRAYEERIQYEPIVGKDGVAVKHVPLNYVVSFTFKDATGQDVTVSIDTKIAEKS